MDRVLDPVLQLVRRHRLGLLPVTALLAAVAGIGAVSTSGASATVAYTHYVDSKWTGKTDVTAGVGSLSCAFREVTHAHYGVGWHFVTAGSDGLSAFTATFLHAGAVSVGTVDTAKGVVVQAGRGVIVFTPTSDTLVAMGGTAGTHPGSGTVTALGHNDMQLSHICEGIPLVDPDPAPSDEPAVDPTDDPAVDPTDDPAVDPTDDPVVDPTDDPVVDPTDDPVVDPTDDPAVDPTDDPAVDPTDDPAVDPTDDPVVDPTDDPAVDPTDDPGVDPTDDPGVDPTDDATDAPTEEPSVAPTVEPPVEPTLEPTVVDEPSDPATVPGDDASSAPSEEPVLDAASDPSVAPGGSPLPVAVKGVKFGKPAHLPFTGGPVQRLALLALLLLLGGVAALVTVGQLRAVPARRRGGAHR